MTIDLISAHIPKTGGTSFGEALRRAYSAEQIFLDYTDRPLEPLSLMNIDPARFLETREAALEAPLRQARVIHGHFWIKKYDFLPRSSFRVTFLRHPVDRLISHYYYWQTQPERGNHIKQYLADNELTLTQFARLPALRNYYTRFYFRDVDMACFDFIGFSETLNADMEKLGQLLGKRFEVVTANTNSHHAYKDARREITENKQTMALLTDLLAEDIRFYERVREQTTR